MFRRRRTPFVLLAVALAPAGVACSDKHASPTPAPVPAPSASTAAVASDAAAPAASAATAALVDAGPYNGPWLASLVMMAPVFSDTEFPSSKDKNEHSPRVIRLGTLRYGEKTPVIPAPIEKPNCPEGWYQLLAGGFVCGRYVTLDLDHPKLKAIKPPDLEGPLPYTYGINMANGTPLYRTVPSHEQRQKAEPWLFKPRKAKTDDTVNPYAVASNTSADAGAGTAIPVSVGENAGDPPPDTPWWEKEDPDGGPPQITLEDLQEASGPISRRMVKGFYLSLDHQFGAAGTSWWRTVANMIAPSYRIMLTQPQTDFHGVWLGRDAATYVKDGTGRRIDKLPMAFVVGYYSKKWTLDEKHKHATASGKVDHFTAVGLTGEHDRVDSLEYWETDEGWWIRGQDAARTDPGPAPENLQPGEKWIDVNLTRQTLVAFEGDKPVYVTLFSSGRDQHETPPGSFRIREKHIASTMDGDAEMASDGPYSIEDVPYIEYFNGGYALHGAFWHAAFGHVKSHGCVNLAPWDAKYIFGWTDPQLPEGWHAVVATKDRPGTRVFVHGRGPGTCTKPDESSPAACPEHYAR